MLLMDPVGQVASIIQNLTRMTNQAKLRKQPFLMVVVKHTELSVTKVIKGTVHQSKVKLSLDLSIQFICIMLSFGDIGLSSAQCVQ